MKTETSNQPVGFGLAEQRTVTGGAMEQRIGAELEPKTVIGAAKTSAVTAASVLEAVAAVC
jgi:hypothetical protein